MPTYPVIEGYKGHAAFGWHVDLRRPAAVRPADRARSPIRRPAICTTSEQLPRRHLNTTRLTGTSAIGTMTRISTICSGRPTAAARATRCIVGYKHPLIYDPPRQLDFTRRSGRYTGLDTLPGAQNIPATVDRNIVSAERRAQLHQHRQSRWARSITRGAVVCEPAMLSDDYARTAASSASSAAASISASRCRWDHSSLWLYNAAGVAGGDQLNPLALLLLRRFRQQLRR